MEISIWECLKCGHKWLPRIKEKPVQCPKCKRTDWSKPRKEKYK